MTFEYLKQTQYLDNIEIENMGDVVLDVYNDEGEEWILSVDTSLGWSRVFQCGPFIADSNTLINSFTFNYFQMEYSEKKLYKIINDFINNDKRIITQIFFISFEDFKKRLKDLDLFQITL